MPEKCNFCDIVYSNKSNRARHERTVHADEKGIPVYHCSICPVTRRQLSEIQSHLSDCHGRFTNLCHYCNLAFNDKNSFNEHIRKQHVLPVLDNSRVVNPIVHQQGQQQQQPGTLTESAFGKSLQSYRIVDSNNTVGLLDFMTAQRD